MLNHFMFRRILHLIDQANEAIPDMTKIRKGGPVDRSHENSEELRISIERKKKE